MLEKMIVLLLAVLPAACPAQEYVMYEMIFLDAPSSHMALGWSINNNGYVAGYGHPSYCEDGIVPIIYDHKSSSYTLLDLTNFNMGRALGINDSNQIVGFVSDTDNCIYPYNDIYKASLFDPDGDGLTVLWDNGQATAINDSSLIAGYMKNPDTGQYEPVVYDLASGWGPMLLGSLGGYIDGGAESINNSGVIAVNYQNSNYHYQAAVILPHGDDIRWGFHTEQLNGLGGGETYASKINDHNQVVGYSLTDEQKRRAVLMEAYKPAIDLGVMDGFEHSVAIGINNSAQIVGYCYNGDCPADRDFTCRGVIFDSSGDKIYVKDLLLNHRDWIIKELIDINEDGWILARAARYENEYGGIAVVLKPVVCTQRIAGDVNNDCQVDFADFAALTANWLECKFEDANYCD